MQCALLADSASRRRYYQTCYLHIFRSVSAVLSFIGLLRRSFIINQNDKLLPENAHVVIAFRNGGKELACFYHPRVILS